MSTTLPSRRSNSVLVPWWYRRVFASGNYPEAERLYDKAISLRPDAVLHANRSAGEWT